MKAKQLSHDVIIFDTAGRTTLDETLMNEIKSIQKLTNLNGFVLYENPIPNFEKIRLTEIFGRTVNF